MERKTGLRLPEFLQIQRPTSGDILQSVGWITTESGTEKAQTAQAESGSGPDCVAVGR